MSNVDWRYCQPQEFDSVTGTWFVRDLGHPYFPFADEVVLKKEEEKERRVHMEKFKKTREEKKKRGEPTLPDDSKIGLTPDIQAEMKKFQQRIFASASEDEDDIAGSEKVGL